MKVDIIIPTFNRAKLVTNVLDCLSKQTVKDFRVIMVNDGSTDETKKVLEKYTEGSQLEIIILNTPNGGRSKARNIGVETSDREIILFLDDDMLPEESFVSKHLNHHLENPDTILSGFQYIDPNLVENDFQKYKCKLESVWRDPFLNQKLEITFEKFNFTSGNMSLSKDIFIKLGGFDTRLKSAVDFDFATRALLQNYKIYYDDSIVAWHSDRVTLQSYKKRHKEYYIANEELLVLHPEYASLHAGFAVSVLNKPSFFKKIAYFIARQVEPVVETGFFLRLPQRVRFKLYETILAANIYT